MSQVIFPVIYASNLFHRSSYDIHPDLYDIVHLSHLVTQISSDKSAFTIVTII